MNQRRPVALALMLSLAVVPLLSAQTRTTSSVAQEATDEVVRITTNLVQVDAVVTDKDGKVVTDLKAEDFELREEGRVQPITNFSFIPLEPAAAAAAANTSPKPTTAAAIKRGAPLPPPMPRRLRPEQVRRTFALAVDDYDLSLASIYRTRDALRKFVDEQVQPGDLVAIFRLSGGSGALQQFTTDKTQLHRIIRDLRWFPRADDVASVFSPARRDDTLKRQFGLDGVSSFEDERTLKLRQQMGATISDIHNSDAVKALYYLVGYISKVPGRKSVVFFSDGLSMRKSRSGDPLGMVKALRRLVDAANRASVVLYTIDARGLVNTDMITAEEDVAPDAGPGDSTTEIRNARRSGLFDSQAGLDYMADATGGLFTHSANDLSRGLRRVLEDQRGYYLIGYRPDEAIFKKTAFRELSVKVNRPGLRVRTRKGFFPVAENTAPARPRTLDQQLYDVLASPFSAGEIGVRLTSLFGDDPRSGSFVRSLLTIDPQQITFADEPGGWKKVVLDVAAVTFGENGSKIVDEFNRTHTVRLGPDTFRHIQSHGFSYTADVPVKKPGAYQLRIVVRDAASKHVGSASQFIEVPDLRKEQLALSGIVLTEADPQQGVAGLPPAATAEAALAPTISDSSPAVRRFRPGVMLSYAHLIYNARLGRASAQPQLTTQVRLFRDGQEVFTGPELPYAAQRSQPGSARLSNAGVFRLRPDALPGDYVLQVIVNDILTGEKRRVASQWIDFELMK